MHVHFSSTNPKATVTTGKQGFIQPKLAATVRNDYSPLSTRVHEKKLTRRNIECNL